jgi:hypothetical protein
MAVESSSHKGQSEVRPFELNLFFLFETSPLDDMCAFKPTSISLVISEDSKNICLL